MRASVVVLAVVGALGAGASPAHRTVTGHLSDGDAVATGGAAAASAAPFVVSATYAGAPVRWDPCTPVHWVFRAPGAPAGGLAMARSAVARVAAATRTTWVLDGTTSATPTTSWLPTRPGQHRPVLVGFTDGAHSDLLHGQPSGVAGMTRTEWFTSDDGRGHRAVAYEGAVVALDRSRAMPLTGAVSWRSVLLHELGHVVGLAHTSRSDELMHPVLGTRLHDYAAGDLQGLARLGRAGGCVTSP